MKSMVRLATRVLKELGEQFCVSTTKDQQTLVRRCVKEGESFLTITLPSFEKDFIQSLSQGYIGSDSFLSFRKDARGLPRFLSGFLSQLFDENLILRTYVYPQHPQIVDAVRQVTLLFSKLERDCTEERISDALSSYVRTDKEIPDISQNHLEEFSRAALQLFGSYFSDVENRLYQGEFIPRHSSGALATRESFNARYSSRVWTDRLEGIFPSWDFLSTNWRDSFEIPPTVLPPSAETPCRVTTVPKTMKTPRIIAMEPVWNQFIQQGILHVMTETLELPSHMPLFYVMCWKDQRFNRDLAEVGSRDGSLATIDLSEASDRVSLSLVHALFKYHPFLLGSVLASRSQFAELPSGELVALKKFASMGSSLCFPIETFVFTTLVWMAAKRECPGESVRAFLFRNVRVYGDDIIAPIDMAPSVIDMLETYGLKVNVRKTFLTGWFRESCGADFYHGAPVKPVRVRGDIDELHADPEVYIRMVAAHNKLFEKGLFESAAYLLSLLNSGGRRVPSCSVGFEGAAAWSYEPDDRDVRWNKNLQRWEQKVLVARHKLPSDPLDSWGALQKFFLNQGDEPLEKNHLTRAGRPQCVGMNTGWLGIW